MKHLYSTRTIYLTSTLPYLPLNQEKTLLDYVRLQVPFDRLSDYYVHDFKNALQVPIPLFYDEEDLGICQLYELIPDNMDSPIFSALYSMLIRTAPADPQEVTTEVQSSCFRIS
jgi:hypothetical protein